jgi:hypothetical protein
MNTESAILSHLPVKQTGQEYLPQIAKHFEDKSTTLGLKGSFWSACGTAHQSGV